MNYFQPLLVTALLAGAACGKKEVAAPTKEQEAQIESGFVPAVAPTQTPAPAARAPTLEDRLDGAVNTELTMRLRMFIDTRGRMPENFYELSNFLGDSVPALPPNMRYEIDHKEKTVKAVKK